MIRNVALDTINGLRCSLESALATAKVSDLDIVTCRAYDCRIAS